MPRQKGSQKTGGRKKGTPNKTTAEAKVACAAIVDDPVYRSNLMSDAELKAELLEVAAML